MEEVPDQEGEEKMIQDGNNSKKSNHSQELEALRVKKEQLESKLEGLEKQIYALEGSYLMDTRNVGNILTGWESYLTSRNGVLKRPMKFKESDRLFSSSSVTSIRNVEIKQPELNVYDAPAQMVTITEERPVKQQKTTPSSNSKKSGPGRPRKPKDEDDYL
eukprot:TRINITY_DN9405_c0_g1_i1.p1 TRINITY_DN9405_c0_g1~~TRINITY_DN9405_c0_g1_i1.p1  ORF type:complete len:161 (-),score=41.10 TRINITY_DN9405_c0_g1_i1:34-516(-)